MKPPVSGNIKVYQSAFFKSKLSGLQTCLLIPHNNGAFLMSATIARLKQVDNHGALQLLASPPAKIMLAAGEEIPVNLFFFCKEKSYNIIVEGTAILASRTHLQNHTGITPALFTTNKNPGSTKALLFTVQIRNAQYYSLQRNGFRIREQFNLMITGWPVLCRLYDTILRYCYFQVSKHLHRKNIRSMFFHFLFPDKKLVTFISDRKMR